MQRPWVWLLLILLGTLGVYVPSFQNGYTYDDRIFVQVPSANQRPNDMVGELKPVTDYWNSWYGEGVQDTGRGYRPLTVYSLALVHRWSRGNAAWQHVVNVLLHCLATLAVYWIVVLFLGQGAGALVAAAVFGLHALRSDPVISIVGRAEILGFLLGAIALLIYVAALRPGPGARLVMLVPAGLCEFLAFSSKENAVSWAVFIPLIVLALGWQGSGLRGLRAQLPAALVLVVPLLIWFWLRAEVLQDLANDPAHQQFVASYQANPLFHLPFWERALSGVMILGFGLYKVLLPFHLACDYGAEVFQPVASVWDLRWLLAFLVLASILAAGFLWARQRPLLFVAMACFFGFSFPVSNIPLPVETIFAERLYYTPALGLSLLLGWLAAWSGDGLAARWRLVGGILLLGWLAACSLSIVLRCLHWRDNETLFTTDASRQPDSVSMQMAAASVYRQRSQSLPEPEASRARARWKQHLDRAHDLNPELPLPLNDMGAYYYDQALRAATPEARERNLETAESWLWKGIRTSHHDLPEYIHNMYRQLAMIQVQRKRYDEAEKLFLKAVEGNDREPDIKMDLGTLYFRTGRRQEALRVWRKLTRDQPGYIRAWERLMRAAAAEGRDKDLEQLLREAEERLGNTPFLDVHRGLLEFGRGRFPQAVGYLERGLPYLPDVASRWEQWLCYGRAALALGDLARVADILRRMAPLLQQLPPEARRGFADLEARLRHGR